jgi:tetratricopeptide (TPR) repeat protein
LKFDPTDAAAIEHAIRLRLQHQGKSLAEAGRLESALAVWQELKRREQASYPQIHMAECLLHLGRLDEAGQVICALERVSPGAVVVAMLRAKLLSEKGNHQEAYEIATGVLRERSDLPQVAYQCGVVAMRMESWQTARGHFDHVLALDADYPGAREALRYLSEMVSTS